MIHIAIDIIIRNVSNNKRLGIKLRITFATKVFIVIETGPHYRFSRISIRSDKNIQNKVYDGPKEKALCNLDRVKLL